MALKFRSDLEVSHYDEGNDKQSVILRDPVSQKFFRISSFELRFLQSLDGSVPLENAVERLRASGHSYTDENARMIVERAARSGLLLGTKYGTAEAQVNLRDTSAKAKKAQRFSSVFFLFVPLFNPDRFLERTLPYVKLVFNKWSAALILLALPGAVYLVVDGLTRMETEYLFWFNFQNLMFLWATIALTKLIHEFAHAYTAKNYGLHVPQMGVGFLIFFPVLFCNTTDAWRIAERKPRIAIAAAGIVAELTLAVIATYVWYFTKPGILNSLGFYLMTVASVSSVLFNGCPLIRFDGYFILSDVVRIPNLMAKSRGYVRYLLMNRSLGMANVVNPATTRREVVIFALHGFGAYIYRFFLYTGIIFGVYYRFDKSIGVLMALVSFVLFIIRPVIKFAKDMYAKRAQIKPQRVGATVLGAIVLAVVVLLFVPLSRNSVYPCFAAPLLSQKLTVPLLTSVDEVFVREGSSLNRGDLVFTLDTNQLNLALLKKDNEGRIIEQELELLRADEKDMPKVGAKMAELNRLTQDLRQLRQDLSLARVGIVAPFDAVVTKLDYKVQKGFQPGEGFVVGELQSSDQLVIYALVPEDDVHYLRPKQEVEIWFPIGTGLTSRESISSIRSYQEKDLKGLPFSSRLGGEVPTEPKGEKHRDVPIEARYLCAVELQGNPNGIPLGITGKLAVSVTPKSLAARWIEAAVKTFNRELFF